MTKKLQSQTLDDGKSRKRILKPVVEKKRRDRINQSLTELRSLLLNSTSDSRLQNPKIEKAEILDLAVEYLKKWTDRKYLSDDSTSRMRPSLVQLGSAEPSVPPFLGIESAGFQQCVSQLASFMQKITPTQRAGLIEGLKHHLESWTLKPDFNQNMTEMPDAVTVDTISTSDSREGSPWLLFPSHSPFQPLSCSTPCHDYLSPPSSPWFSPPFPTYATSPPFPSFPCHFSFPPSLSPPSCNTSFFSVSPTLPHTNPLGLHIPPLTSLIPPSNLAHREESAPNSSSATWRPWL
ncbi:hairy-related 11 [Melanotaenia boesemani]|uniref:hairy-related 11 n=1 Tax=Melanotaenia boesemani TaxID=1250792 RepID=UPI001C03A753|nr:hairy-related 11 [Melanotaenia boesemani]